MDRIVEKRSIGGPKQPKVTRVAAYARVSSGKDAMLHSLSAQVSYYSDLIQTQPGWMYAGVYSDEAKTGTKTPPRFQTCLPTAGRKDRPRACEVDLTLAVTRSHCLETVRDCVPRCGCVL